MERDGVRGLEYENVGSLLTPCGYSDIESETKDPLGPLL